MQTNTVPEMDNDGNTTACRPRFSPVGWDGRHLHFEDKLFVHAKNRSLLHFPLNMGKMFARVQAHIKDAGAQDPEGYFVLSRDLSPAEGEHFLAVTGDVPGEDMATLSGDFITRVFEGPYRKAKDWVHEMETAAAAVAKTASAVYMFYTTCPRCARAYGRNYVIGVAEVIQTSAQPGGSYERP